MSRFPGFPFLSSLGLALILLSLFVVPADVGYAQSNGQAQCQSNCEPGTKDGCFTGAGSCDDNGSNCSQVVFPSDCGACHCKYIQNSCLCRK
jgi:hypothetical protein